ncbi:MAG: hypothetical protein ACYC35_12690 [Pirellulales bacterium]
MSEPALREPEQIRQDCARKLRPIETSGMFTAILGCLLGEDWATPRIEQLIVTDKCLLARPAGEVTHKLFLGAEEDLIRNVHGIAKTADLDGDELGYLLAAIAKIKRVE